MTLATKLLMTTVSPLMNFGHGAPTVGPLVQRIRSKLNAEDSSLLSNDALTMIFDSSDNSVRDGGNKAAHEAPLSDCIDSVLEATLTEARRVLLGKIYYFAHGKEPDFETATA